MLNNPTFTFAGIQIHESPHITPVPVIKTRPDFEWCSEEFRAKHDAWLLERFGTYDPAYVVNREIFMSPRSAAKLRQLVKEKTAHPGQYSLRELMEEACANS